MISFRIGEKNRPETTLLQGKRAPFNRLSGAIDFMAWSSEYARAFWSSEAALRVFTPRGAHPRAVM
jgi:hypothetical protein